MKERYCTPGAASTIVKRCSSWGSFHCCGLTASWYGDLANQHSTTVLKLLTLSSDWYKIEKDYPLCWALSSCYGAYLRLYIGFWTIPILLAPSRNASETGKKRCSQAWVYSSKVGGQIVQLRGCRLFNLSVFFLPRHGPWLRTICCFHPGGIENWTSSSFYARPVHVDRITGWSETKRCIGGLEESLDW